MGRQAFPGRRVVLDRLQRMLEIGRLGQPVLLTGPEGCGKENTALEFARLVNCAGPEVCTPAAPCESCVKALSFQHPDIRWIGPAPATLKEDGIRNLFEAKQTNPFFHPPYAATSHVSIGDPEDPAPLTIRSLIQFLRKRAFQGKYKVAVISDAHRMNAAAANAFLKTLEEPPPNTLIFLLAPGIEGLLATIVSRCLKITVLPWSEEELAGLLHQIAGIEAKEAERVAHMAEGNARRGMALLEPEAQIMTEWAILIFDWIQRGNRAMVQIAADELHRGALSHACSKGGLSAKAAVAKEFTHRRDRAIRLCEWLNILYSDALQARETGQDWRPRLPGAREIVERTAQACSTGTLLDDMARIESSRKEIDRNINIGLAMAVLFEGLIENAERDQAARRARA